MPRLRFKDAQGQDYPALSVGQIGDYCNEIKATVDPSETPDKEFVEYSMPAFDAGKTPIISMGKNMLSTRKLIGQPCLLVNKLNVRKQRIWLHDKAENNAVCSTEFVALGVKKNCYLAYFEQLVLTNHFTTYLVNNSSGTSNSQKRVSPKTIFKYRYYFPSLPEQEKIADFLTACDRMIEVQAGRVEAMKTRKKGLLQKIFSREIRFKDAQGQDYPEWEVKSVEDLADDIIGGGTPSTKNSTFYTGDIPWVSSSDLLEDRINYLNMTRFITQEAIRSSATKLIPAKSVMIVSRVGVGKVAINTVPLCTSQDFMNLVVKKEYSTEFVAYLLMNLMLRKKNSVQGTAIKGIPSAEIRKFEVLIPTLSEQEKIADFLTSVDTQIEVEEKRLETMKIIKKGLLQQMFI